MSAREVQNAPTATPAGRFLSTLPVLVLFFLSAAALSGCGGPADGPVAPSVTQEEIDAQDAAIKAAQNAPRGAQVESP